MGSGVVLRIRIERGLRVVNFMAYRGVRGILAEFRHLCQACWGELCCLD